MPRQDPKSGQLVIRIVFDGPPEAGKTTTIDALGSVISLERRSPGSARQLPKGRTEFFDWLDFAGGSLDGRPMRCQLVSVPGQSSLLHRRLYLLRDADAVVFVADATSTTLAGTRRDLETTLKHVARLAGEVPIGIVLQVNKQDAEGARSPETVATELCAPRLMPVVGTSARVGTGVLQTLMLAVRLATDRLGALVQRDAVPTLGEDSSGPEALHRAMLALEPADQSHALARGQPRADQPGASSRAESMRAMLAGTRRVNPVELTPRELPQPTALPAGCIWPAVAGRAALAAALQGSVEAPASLSDFAPSDACELRSNTGWLLHTTARWRFATEGEARWSLLGVARVLAESTSLLPEGRTLLIAPDAGAWRLWMLTAPTPNVVDLAARAIETNDSPGLARLVQQVQEFAEARGNLGRLARTARLLDLGVQRSGLVVLSLPDPYGPQARVKSELSEIPDVLAELVELLACVQDASAGASFAGAGRVLFDQIERAKKRDRG